MEPRNNHSGRNIENRIAKFLQSLGSDCWASRSEISGALSHNIPSRDIYQAIRSLSVRGLVVGRVVTNTGGRDREEWSWREHAQRL